MIDQGGFINRASGPLPTAIRGIAGLRREWDRMRLEASLGWDADLITELGL